MQLFAQCRQMFSKGPLNIGLQCKYGEYGLPPHSTVEVDPILQDTPCEPFLEILNPSLSGIIVYCMNCNLKYWNVYIMWIQQ